MRPLGLIIPRLICWLIGHHWDYGYAMDYDLARCARCCEVEPNYGLPASALYKLSCWWKWKVRVPLEKCPDCGLRFQRHNPDIEHLPF
jgi:hypothetical protein